ERNRMNLALTLKQGGNLLLLDEPTNDLDVETLASLENALLEFPGCAVITSHDRWFLDRVATHILAWEGGANWFWYEGNFEAYEKNKIDRLGAEAARPHRVTYRRLGRESPAQRLSRSAHQPEERAELVHEQRGLLERGEVPAAFRLAPVPDVGKALLRPPPGRPLQLAREHRTAHRDGDRLGVRAGDPLVHLPDALPVQPRGRGAGAGQPVQHHVVQQVVP